MATTEEYARAAQAVQSGTASRTQQELNDRAAKSSRWGNKLAQEAQDAQQGKLRR